MTVTLSAFVDELSATPALLVTVILTLGVVLVNGWTDAPNAIATCVSTRSIGVRQAIVMAAVFNFLGVFFMTLISAGVAETIYKMVDFRGDSHTALMACPLEYQHDHQAGHHVQQAMHKDAGDDGAA